MKRTENFPFSKWEWRNYFIKLSDSIGESPEDPLLLLEAAFCETKLIAYPDFAMYPLKHKLNDKDYYFFVKDNTLYFKTYEGEGYLDKYYQWHKGTNDKDSESKRIY